MERTPTNGFEWLEESVDVEADEAHFEYTRLTGILATLESWRHPLPPEAKMPQRRERDSLIQQWNKDIAQFFHDIENSPWRCSFQVGHTEIKGHYLRPLGEERALFGAALLYPRASFIIDYMAEHTVPQGATYDLPPGSMHRDQIYLGDKRRQVAISLKQLSQTLFSGGRLWLETKSNYPLE